MPSLLQFQGAAPGTLYRVSIEKDFHLSVGENDGTDVAPLHDNAILFRNAALMAEQCTADAWDGGDVRGCSGHGGFANGVADILSIQKDATVPWDKVQNGFLGKLLKTVHVARFDMQAQSPESDGAVHGAAIDIDEAQLFGHAPGQCTLARAGRTVDSNYDAFLAHEGSWRQASAFSESSGLTGVVSR